jgi:glycosyltransferase involved in cell wall biosynthesis
MVVQNRLSVITPSFNQAAYLGQTIQSVLSQDYPDIEYIIVDGGSRDGSVDIIQQYADRLAWWVSEPDAGQANAINKGFWRATGEFIAWVNSDDFYLPGAVIKAVQALQAHPEAAFVYGNMVAVDGQGEAINLLRYRQCQVEDLLQFYILGQPAVFFRRSVLEQAGYLDEQYHYMLDHHLWIRMASLAPIVFIDQFLAAARYHSGAKNIAQPEGFTREAYHLAKRMLDDAQMGRRARLIESKIWAGAHRTGAFYLLDAGKPRQALGAYARSLFAYPAAALQDWRRILFACASLVVDPERLRRQYLENRFNKVREEAKSLNIYYHS